MFVVQDLVEDHRQRPRLGQAEQGGEDGEDRDEDQRAAIWGKVGPDPRQHLPQLPTLAPPTRRLWAKRAAHLHWPEGRRHLEMSSVAAGPAARTMAICGPGAWRNGTVPVGGVGSFARLASPSSLASPSCPS